MTDPAEPAAVTDAGGKWRFGHFPSELENVDVTLVRPNESRQSFSTSKKLQPLDPIPVIPLQALKDQTAVFTLHDGMTVRGIVVDEKGKPLSGVLVKEGFGHGAYLQRVAEFRTDADGRFERHNRAPRQWIYTASGGGRATVSAIAQVELTMPEIRIVLPPAKPLRLRVQDENGNAIPDASVRLTRLNDGQILDWEIRLDADGRATWTNAPTGPVSLYVEKLGAGREFKALAGDGENVCILSRSGDGRAAIQIKAFDVKTRIPVKMRSVAAFRNGEFTYKTLAEPTASEAKVEIRSTDFKVGMGTIFGQASAPAL